VVCRRDNGAVPRKVEELVGKNIEVIASSSYVERLQELSQQIPGLKWTEVSDAGTEQLLEKVWLKQIDCTVADSNIVSINRRYYPELLVAFPLAEDQALAWILADNWKHLGPDLEQWLEQIEQNGDLAAIHEKYYGHVDIFDYVDMRQFISRIKTRLPKYREDFVRESKVAGVDWSLLAAQAYQESHWNPHAKSPTGVRGMMMLTLNTAKSVGVKNRLDAKQSIKGGARYLARMIKRVPESVQGENRVWLALAAYNVGFAHLQDARILAEQLGKNPDSWTELKQVLPLLSQKKYYKKLKYGYARGSEPVTYVQRIRDYQQVLLQGLK
jgi:membrane-bound lytic murein transglycosylase F